MSTVNDLKLVAENLFMDDENEDVNDLSVNLDDLILPPTKPMSLTVEDLNNGEDKIQLQSSPRIPIEQQNLLEYSGAFDIHSRLLLSSERGGMEDDLQDL